MTSLRPTSGVAVQNVERSRTSKVSGSCQKVSGSWRRLARRYTTSSSPERRSTYAHARRTGVTSGGRSTLSPCQNVETEFMTPVATVLHNKSFLRAAATTYFSTPYVAHSSAHVFLSFLCTKTTMPSRVDSEFKQYTDCIKQYITKKTHLASDTRMRNAVVRAVKTGNYQVGGE